MADSHAPIDDARVHHEESDVDIAAIFTFGGGLAALIGVLCVVVWLMFRYFDVRESAGTREYPLAAGQEATPPPEPRLQERPREDLRDMRAQEDAILNSYGWVDRDAGTVRIPIGEAMRLTVERGLPARSNEPATAPPPGRQP